MKQRVFQCVSVLQLYAWALETARERGGDSRAKKGRKAVDLRTEVSMYNV